MKIKSNALRNDRVKNHVHIPPVWVLISWIPPQKYLNMEYFLIGIVCSTCYGRFPTHAQTKVPAARRDFSL